MKQKKKNKKERNHRKGQKKQNGKLIKDKIIQDIRSSFEEEEDYSTPKRGSSFWNNNYIEYKSNGDKSSNLSLDKYLHKVKAYLRDIIVDL